MGTKHSILDRSILDPIGVAAGRVWGALRRGRAILNEEEFDAGYRAGYRAGARAAREELTSGRLPEVAEREVAGVRKAS